MAKAIILIFERVGKDLVCTTRKKKKKKNICQNQICKHHGLSAPYKPSCY